MNAATKSALRSLDASGADLTPAERERAAEALERIVATTPAPGGARPAARRRVLRSPRGLAIVAAAAVALIVASAVSRSDRGGDAAYASWTPTPAAVASEERSAAASACRNALEGSSLDPRRAELALAERRGDHVALLYRTDDPDMSGACLVRNPAGSTEVDDVRAGVGGGSGPAQKAPAKGYTQGAISQFAGTPAVSITDGAVGEAVTGVTIHAGAFTVQASVRDGRYTAWWPGPAFERGAPEPSGEGGPEPVLTYDLTLADGTVVRDAAPTRPR